MIWSIKYTLFNSEETVEFDDKKSKSLDVQAANDYVSNLIKTINKTIDDYNEKDTNIDKLPYPNFQMQPKA